MGRMSCYEVIGYETPYGDLELSHRVFGYDECCEEPHYRITLGEDIDGECEQEWLFYDYEEAQEFLEAKAQELMKGE